MNTRMMSFGLLVLLAQGCVSVQVQKEKVGAAKKLAIVGYSGVLALGDDKPKSGLAATIGGIKKAADLSSGNLDARRVEQAEAGYAELARRLKDTLGVTVSDRSVLTSSQTLSGLLQKSPSAGIMVVGLQRLPDVLRPEIVNAASPEVRQAVAAELGVDAIAVAKIRYEVGRSGGFAIGGVGKTLSYPRAIVEFSVYDGSGQRVWHDLFARGETTKEGLATTMGAEIVANENEILGEALSSGYDALFAHYQAAN